LIEELLKRCQSEARKGVIGETKFGKRKLKKEGEDGFVSLILRSRGGFVGEGNDRGWAWLASKSFGRGPAHKCRALNNPEQSQHARAQIKVVKCERPDWPIDAASLSVTVRHRRPRSQNRERQRE